MKKTIVIVDPRSSGKDLAPTFNRSGFNCVAVSFDPLRQRSGFGTEINENDFIEVVPFQENLEEVLSKFKPLAIIPGADRGVPLAEELCKKLTPKFQNCSQSISDRLNKFQMQQALKENHVPYLKTLETSSVKKAREWLGQEQLLGKSFILKPPVSAGSERVYHIKPSEDWERRFVEISASKSNMTGFKNHKVIVQEQALGHEYCLGTVSANGKHHLAHLIKYSKVQKNGRQTVYDHVEFVDHSSVEAQELVSYTFRTLEALGIKWGACHNEVIMTPHGPRLIESTPRMTGGPVVDFARRATGSSQADQLVEAYLYGEVRAGEYRLQQSLVPVFISSSQCGHIRNLEVFDEVLGLKTFYKNHLWVKNGDLVGKTVDYLSSLGIIALCGKREDINHDFRKIRKLESQLKIEPLENSL